MAVVGVAAGEAVGAGGDQLARVDPDSVLLAALVLVDSTWATEGRGGRGVGGAVEAAGFVAVPADELERDQVDVEEVVWTLDRLGRSGRQNRRSNLTVASAAVSWAVSRAVSRRAVEVGIMGSGSVLRGAVFGKFLASRP
jgi:hypothetical protein